MKVLLVSFVALLTAPSLAASVGGSQSHATPPPTTDQSSAGVTSANGFGPTATPSTNNVYGGTPGTSLSTGPMAPPSVNAAAFATPQCRNAQVVSEIKAFAMQVNNLAAQIKSRQAELAALTAQRNTMLAGIAGAKTPAEKASRQNALDAIDAKIAALNGAIAGNQNAMNNDKAQIAKLDALKPC